MADIKKLIDRKTGKTIYPQTIAKAIYDSYGKDLQTRLDELNQNYVATSAQVLTDEQKAQARGNINAAPGGFGLGEASIAFSDANDCVTNGWYCDVNGTAANTPFTWCHILVSTFMGNGMYVRQDAYITGESNVSTRHMVRFKHPNITDNNGWSVWEWEHGMYMYPGVEYRTTERYLGKPVYVSLRKMGACSVGESITSNAGLASISKIVSVSGFAEGANAGKGIALPHLYGVPGTNDFVRYSISLSAQLSASGTGDVVIIIGCGAGRSFNSADVLIKYTKTTD